MKLGFILIVSLSAGLLVGCGQREEPASPPPATPPAMRDTGAPTTAPTPAEKPTTELATDAPKSNTSATSEGPDYGATEADQMLNQRLREQLKQDPTLPDVGKHIRLHTENGKITLEGTVTGADQKLAIETRAKTLATGVAQVVNKLEVKP